MTRRVALPCAGSPGGAGGSRGGGGDSRNGDGVDRHRGRGLASDGPTCDEIGGALLGLARSIVRERSSRLCGPLPSCRKSHSVRGRRRIPSRRSHPARSPRRSARLSMSRTSGRGSTKESRAGLPDVPACRPRPCGCWSRSSGGAASSEATWSGRLAADPAAGPPGPGPPGRPVRGPAPPMPPPTPPPPPPNEKFSIGAAIKPNPNRRRGRPTTTGRGNQAGRGHGPPDRRPPARRALNLHLPIECSSRPLDLDRPFDRTRASLDLHLALDRSSARTGDRRISFDRLAASPTSPKRICPDPQSQITTIRILHPDHRTTLPCDPALAYRRMFMRAINSTLEPT